MTSTTPLPRVPLRAVPRLVPLFLVLAALAGAARAQETHKLLDSRGFTDRVEVTGEAWVRRGGGMQAEGGGRVVRTRHQVSRGDFSMRAELTFEDLEKSGALFELGGNVFCFAARKGDSPLFVRGPDLNPKDDKELVLPSSERRTPEKQKFEFVVRRDGTLLRILFDREVIHSAEVGDGPLGRVGFQPRRATLRIHSWTLTGALMDPAKDGGALARLQPAINEAIDKGVDALLEAQQRDGSWEYEGKRYRNGQTALCMYTLLKCGVDAQHPAVQRARAFLSSAPPLETYAVACQIMAFEATKEPALKPEIEVLTDWLLEWQKGGWSYPWDHAWENWHEKEGLIDLSNSQYAALGLRSAEFAGVEVPDRAWKRLLKDTLNHQNSPRKVDAPSADGRTTTGKREVAGFGYRLNENPTGSMTTAGIAVVEICRRGLGDKLSGSDARKVKKSRDLALAWLELNFDVVKNPGNPEWVYYYLYGLERVGSLLALESIGPHAWYYEGAKRLVKVQADDGTWTQRNREADTCFALLFLERATGSTTGPGATPPRDLLVSEEHDADVRFRASGGHRLTVWLTGISDEARADHGVTRGRRKELFLQRVEYWLDGAPAAKVDCPPTAWQGEGHAARLEVDSAGEHRLQVKVVLALPEDADPLTTKARVIESEVLEFDVDAGLEDWMLPLAAASGSTLLADHGTTATASCSAAEHRGAENVLDGIQNTAWVCKTGGAEPVLRLDFDRPLRARTLVLQQAATRPKDRYSFDLVRAIELRFPGTKQAPQRFEMPTDPFVPGFVDLPEGIALRQLEIAIVETEDGGSADGVAGFAEVGVQVPGD